MINNNLQLFWKFNPTKNFNEKIIIIIKLNSSY